LGSDNREDVGGVEVTMHHAGGRQMVLFLALGLATACRPAADPVADTLIIEETYGIELVLIPAGDLRWDADETRHAMTVHLGSFYMGRSEVTQRQWRAVMGDYPVELDWDALPAGFQAEGAISERARELAEGSVQLGDSLPVERISWNAAQAFVQRLSETSGHEYRLPTTAEWEYACKSGSAGDYHFGNDTLVLGEYEWYGENSGGQPHPVGQKRPTPWGLYDLSGNVAEWTSTIADMAPYERLYPDRDFGPGISRVYRGSHYLHNKTAARCDYSHTYQQALPRGPVGLRVVRER
jgi:formylglycine-generating enzyme required for sulfatase activity